MVNARAELTPEAQRLILKLKTSDAMPGLRKEMRAAGAPMVQEAKRAARQLPSGRSRYKTPGGSLRNAIANSIQQKLRLSARTVLLLVKQVPQGGKSNLGNVVEGTISPWEHPTFGHKPKVTQQAEPFFYKTLDRMEPETSARIERVLDDFEKRL
jgi:hypothetical protein